MIWEWLAQGPVFLVAAAVFFLPGIGIGAALRIRGLALWALAPIGSVVLFAVLAIIYQIIGITWNVLSIVAGALIVVALAWLATLKIGPARKPAPASAATWILLAAIVLGSLLGALRFGFYVGVPDAISQTNDAIFHLNALRWIAETGSASSLTISGVIGASSFYPGAWHAITSATAMLSFAELPTAANMVALVITTMVWPLGIVWFTRRVTHPYRNRRMMSYAPVFAAVLSSAMLSFPLMLFQWGVLYPNALSMALLPAAATVVLFAPSWLAGRGPVTGKAASGIIWGVIVLAALGALVLSQPSTLLPWGVIVLAWYLSWTIGQLRNANLKKRAVLVLAVLAAIVVFAFVWFVLSKSTSGSHWAPFAGRIEAFGEIILNAQLLTPPAILISILMLIGLSYTAWHPRLLWLSAVWAVFSGLYFVAATVGRAEVRDLILGAWYADTYRLAALAPLAVIPLAAIGFAWMCAVLQRMFGSANKVATIGVGLLAVSGGVELAVAPIIQMRFLAERTTETESIYTLSDDSFLSLDERLLLERIAESVSDDAVIIANPSTGAAFGYALSGRNVYPRTWSPPRTVDWEIIAQQLRDVDDDPAVCGALINYGSPDFVLDFGPGEIASGRWVMPGMTDFEGQPGFELVDSQGTASLWRITACN